MAELRTGYAKPLIFHLLPSLFLEKINYSQRHVPSASVHPVIVAVSPLNALIKDQIRRSKIGFKRLPLSPGLSRGKFCTYPPLALIFCLLHPRFWDTRDQTGPGSLLARLRGRLLRDHGNEVVVSNALEGPLIVQPCIHFSQLPEISYQQGQ